MLNFYAALHIYQVMFQPFDLALLPVHVKSYTRDTAGRFHLSSGVIVRKGTGTWLEAANYRLNSTRQRFDTSWGYQKLDSARRVVRLCDSLTEGPLRSGSDFRFESGRLVERVTYHDGKPYWRTLFEHEGGHMIRYTTLDSASDTAFAANYSYAGDTLIGIEFFPATGFHKWSYTYVTPDSVVVLEANPAGDAKIQHVLALRGGSLQRLYGHGDDSVAIYTEFIYNDADALAIRRRPQQRGSWKPPTTDFDLLGRALP